MTSYWSATPMATRVPAALQSAFERFRRRTEADAERRARWELAENRRLEVEQVSNATEHFLRISTESQDQKRPSRGQRKVRRMRSSFHPVRVIGTALVSVYLLLLAVSSLTTSPLERTARLQEQDLSWTQLGETTRGRDVEWQQDVRNRYKQAITHAMESRRGPLVPGRYDVRSLSEARDRMELAIRLQSQREGVPGRAFLILGKLNILLGDTAAAASPLEMARSRGGTTGREASELLQLMGR